MSTVGSTAPASRMSLPARGEQGATPVFVWWIILAAWSTAAIIHAAGWGELLGHDELFTGNTPLWLTLALFLASWQVMVAAMMLPSSIPRLRQFAAAIPPDAHRSASLASFLGGYALTWTAFGIAALLGDGVVHTIVDGSPWLAARPWVIGGAALVLAGCFELRTRRPRRAVAVEPGHCDGRRTAAIRTGADHGLQQLRHCWPLMLVSFAAGMASLVWMAVLTVIMALPQGPQDGRRPAAAHAGAGLLAVGALVLVHPAWLPPLFPGS